MGVRVREKLYAEDIADLFEKNCSAVRIYQYYSQSDCAELVKRLSKSDLGGRYVNAPKIGRVGKAFFECQADEESSRQYRKHSKDWIAQLRKEFSPLQTPIDRIRLEFDEAWNAGARLHIMDGCKMFAGLARTFDQGSEAEPHQDVLAWDSDLPDAQAVTQQLAVNLYLSMPEKGGELELWDRELTKNEYEDFRNPGSYGVRRDKIGKAAQVITPVVGELIVFNAQNVHAVANIEQGRRVTWSAFVGRTTQNRALVMWS